MKRTQLLVNLRAATTSMAQTAVRLDYCDQGVTLADEKATREQLREQLRDQIANARGYLNMIEETLRA